MAPRMYCAVIGDINRSRLLPNRGSIQKRFAGAVGKINSEFRDAIASRFLITLGDEFQGLLRLPEVSYDLVRRFEEIMSPTPFAFGVGIGGLSTPLHEEALGMDGEAFHRARNSLLEAKRLKRTLCYSFKSDSELMVNALVAMMDLQWHRVTPRQKEIVRMLKDHSQKEVARRLRVSVQAISKAKQSAGMEELEEASRALQETLAGLKQPL